MVDEMLGYYRLTVDVGDGDIVLLIKLSGEMYENFSVILSKLGDSATLEPGALSETECREEVRLAPSPQVSRRAVFLVDEINYRTGAIENLALHLSDDVTLSEIWTDGGNDWGYNFKNMIWLIQ